MHKKQYNSRNTPIKSFRLRMPVQIHARLKALSEAHNLTMQRIIIPALIEEIERLENAEA